MYLSIVILMYAMWSSIFPLAKQTLEFCPPLFLTAVRMLLAGAILLGYLAIRNRSSFQISTKQFLSLGLYALLSMYLTNAFEFWSVMHLSAAKTCFLYSLSPFFAAFFSYLHFGEKMNRRKWIGMGIGFTIGLLALGTVREILGAGSLFGVSLFGADFQPWVVMVLPPGGFFVLGAWLLLFATLERRKQRKLAEATQNA